MTYTGSTSAKKVSLKVRFRYIFLLATLSVTSILIILISSNPKSAILINNIPRTTWEGHKYDNVDYDERFTIKTEGCNIPALKPMDSDIQKYVMFPETLKPCPNMNISLLDNDKSRIWIKTENLHYYNINKDDHLTCCYQSFYRPLAIENIMSSQIDDRAKYEDCIFFDSEINVNNEFVRVTCSAKTITFYTKYFVFAPKKKFIVHDDKTQISGNKSAFNVLILGIDAVSRLNFYRTMPKTIAYIQNKGAVELLGYNKVGDNTFPNVIPMLMGIKDTELKQTCLPHERATFDNCPFIWEWFKQAGYYTALGEDCSNLGTFNYIKVGFSNTPTDYYLHTFINEAEKNVGNNKDFNSFLCMGEKYFYNVLLDYIEDLTSTLKQSKLFGFFWEVTMSHDYLNYPMTMDDSYERFFQRLDTSGYLNETIIFLVSDHGIRWGGIRSTKQGRLEERLPFVFVLVPQQFRDKYSSAYNNLRQNSKRLTSPFDVHATLNDLINLDNIEDENISMKTKNSYANNRGISLFIPIPMNRTCKMAGIDDHWCTCHEGSKIPKDSTEGMEAAANLVRHINMLLRDHTECARLSQAEILDVTEMKVGTPDKDELSWREFMVVVRTKPGSGVFEATLRQHAHEWILSGTISRLNIYGDQSRCVHHPLLKLYCYCS